MKLTRRTLGWGALLALALLGLATLPVAWAAPEGRGLLQTVPTRTPTPGPATNTPVPPAPTQPPQQPTDAPPATPTVAQVAATATATPSSAVAQSTPTPTLTPTTSVDEGSEEAEGSGVQGEAAAPAVTATGTQTPSVGVTTTEGVMTPTATAVDPVQAGDVIPTHDDAATTTAEPVAVIGRSDTSRTWIWVLGVGGVVLGAGIALLLKFRK